MQETPNDLGAYNALDRLANVYTRGVDRRDVALIKSVYHEDAIDDHGSYFSGNAHDFADKLPGIMAAFKISSHCIANRIFEVDGDYAEGELYLLSYTILNDRPDELYEVGGRYLDRYEKRGGEWKIAHRRLVWDWATVTPVASGDRAIETLGEVGVAGPGDVSYAQFRLLRRSAE